MRAASLTCVLVLSLGGVPSLAQPANIRVNDAAADTTSNDTQTNPAVVRIGSTVIAAFFDTGSRASGSKTDGLARSTDGGLTWTDLGAYPASSYGDYNFPRLAWNAANSALVTTVAPLSVTNAVPFFRSTNGGGTFSTAVNAAPTSSSVDFPMLLSDNLASSPFYGSLYVAYREFGANPGMKLTRSTDAGTTWSTGVNVAPAVSGHGATPFALPGGVVGVSFWESGTPARIALSRTTDGGSTFSVVYHSPALVTTGVNGDLGLAFRTNAFPRGASNPSNDQVYLVWNDATSATGGDRGDIYFRHSTDMGFTWSAPLKVNDDPVDFDLDHAQFHPAIAVNPAGTHLLVAWYDRRSDPADTAIEVWGAIAKLTGSVPVFGPNFRISNTSFAPVYGVDTLAPATMFCDLIGVDADAAGWDVVWADGRDASVFPMAARKNLNIRYARVPFPVRGDANGDHSVTVGDVLYLINNLFAGGPSPAGPCQGDANHDSATTVADVLFLINYLFASGPAPAPPC